MDVISLPRSNFHDFSLTVVKAIALIREYAP